MEILGFSITRTERARRAHARAIAVLSGGAVLCSGGAAWAVWSASGSGSGTGAAGTAGAITTTAATAPTTLLYPGGTGDLKITYSNPNSFAVTVTSLAATGTVTASGGIGTCTTTGVSLVSPQAVSHVVPAKVGSTNGTATFTVANAVQMSNASETGCQGASFTIPVTITAASS